MPLRIKDISVLPKGDWQYYVESTNYTVTTKNYYRLYPEVVEHCKTNNVTVPSEQEVIDQMCDKLYIPCFESEDMQTPFVNKWFLGLPPQVRRGCCGG